MRFTIAFLCLFLLRSPPPAAAEPVETIRDHGEAGNRVDIAILGDGYTASELSQYRADVEAFVTGLFLASPFNEYSRYFNVHRIDVVSSESGADHPEHKPPVFRNTAFDARYNCFDIPRLICVDDNKVLEVLFRSIAPERRDVIIVIVNDPEYGGSGGMLAVASRNAQVVELVLHELGHSFGLLADEYVDAQLCNENAEPPEANATKQSDRNAIKWNTGGGPPTGWVASTTPIPTPDHSGVVGLYPGGRYCSKLFRPSFDSKMRSLDRPFEQVNSEQLVRRIYNWVSPIDSSEPVAASITLPADATQVFSVTTPAPATGAIRTTWKLDAHDATPGSQFTLAAAGLSPGVHTLTLLAEDRTPLVRHDPAGMLLDTRVWQVNVELAPLEPDTLITSAPPLTSRSAGAVFTFGSPAANSRFACSLDGARFSPCKSPKRFSRLASGVHAFAVRASAAGGFADSTPATYAWTIDTSAPDTVITAQPAPLAKSANATFAFASTESNTGFNCRLNKGPFAACTSPHAFTGLSSGRYTFQVAAVDGAGNVDRKAASYKWIVDTVPPDTRIKGKTVAAAASSTATFAFSATERGSTFECSLDGGPFSACASPATYTVAAGPHTFQVRATDRAGNTDASPATHSWIVQQGRVLASR
jgi:hypothetical protein